MLKRCLLLLVSVTTVATARAQAQAQPLSPIGGMAISPLIQRVRTTSGRTVDVAFGITNPSPQASEATAELVSVTFEKGTYKPVATDHPNDLTKYAVQPSLSARLAPGKDGEIHFKFKLPSGLSGAYWTLLKFQPRSAGSAAGLTLNYEVPIVLMVGRQARPEVSVQAPTLASSGKEGLQVEVGLENSGDGYTPIGVSGELRNEAGGASRSFSISDRNLFPHSSRTMAFPMANLPDGRYRIFAQVEMGARRLPRIVSEVAVVKGKAEPITEDARFETMPVVANPGGFSDSLPPGGSKTQALKLTNLSKEAVTVDLRAAGVAQTTDGVLGVGGASLPEGLSVQISPESVTIEPNRTVGVRVVARADAAASGDKWFCVTIGDATRKGFLPNFVAGNFVVNRNIVTKIDLSLDRIDRVAGRPAGLAFTVRNVGNLAVRPITSGQILQDGVRLAGLIQIPEMGIGGILPGVTLKNVATLPPSLPPGKYVAVIRYGLGDSDPSGLRVPFEIPKAAPAKAKTKVGAGGKPPAKAKKP